MSKEEKAKEKAIEERSNRLKLISKLPVIKSNLQYIAESGSVNGSLMLSIEKLMDEYTESQLTAYKEALREILKMCDTLGIDDHYLFPEVQEAIKLINTESNDSK